MIAANPGYWCNETPPESVEGWRFSYDAYQNVAASVFDENGDQVSVIEGTGHELIAEEPAQSLAAMRVYLDRSAASVK